MTIQSTGDTSQRVFHASEFVTTDSKTVSMVYRGADLSALVEWVEPGGDIAETPHKHPRTAHTFVVLEGEGEALVGKGQWQKVRAGDFIVNPRDKVHAMRNTSPDQRLMWVCTDVGPHEVVETTEDDD